MHQQNFFAGAMGGVVDTIQQLREVGVRSLGAVDAAESHHIGARPRRRLGHEDAAPRFADDEGLALQEFVRSLQGALAHAELGADFGERGQFVAGGQLTVFNLPLIGSGDLGVAGQGFRKLRHWSVPPYWYGLL